MEEMKKKLFVEISDHLIEDVSPSLYLNRISEEPIFTEYPFNQLRKLKDTEQSKKYHPEGSVWNHTMLVVDEAARVKNQSKDKKVFMWAALLHDIGKPDTTRIKKGKITSYDHDKVGSELCLTFLKLFTDEEEFIDKVIGLVRYHMHMLYVLKKLPYANTKKLLQVVDINEIALLCKCDRMGRTGVDRVEEEENYKNFLRELQILISSNDRA